MDRINGISHIVGTNCIDASAAVRPAGRPAPIVALVTLLAALLALGIAPFQAAEAWAADDAGKASRPSVLVLDSGLGDYDLCNLHWIGEGSKSLADNNGLSLTTSSDPAWWAAGGGTGAAPATFLLGGAQSGAPSAEAIAWALDQIRVSGAEPRTFVLAMGESGLALREYAEDLAVEKQTQRVDLVGMGFCGTPHSGYGAIELYPEQAMWDTLAASAGLTRSDLTPGSALLGKLDGGSFPNVTETLVVNGAVGDLGFGLTDGAGTLDDFALSESVTDQVVVSQVASTIGQALNLTGLWQPFTSSINYPRREVDSKLVERLSGMADYATSSEVKSVVREFYDSWFSEGAPVTYNASTLLLDLSGSMVEPIDAGGDKLSSAKEAAKQYLRVVQSYSELPQSPPASVTTFGFGEQTDLVAEGYDQAACDALDRMSASGETNIGVALGRALETLKGAPTCADKHVLLLSDGESTRGLSDDEMLAGPIAAAAADGVVIDTIGFGDVGESDAGFLEQVAAATGGAYYQADDTYSLKVNFLKSYYTSMGLNLVDEEVAPGSAGTQGLGTADARTSAIQVGVVGSTDAPNVTLLCNGNPLDGSNYEVRQENGLTSLQCVNPPQGDYSLKVDAGQEAVHVFAVKQLGVPRAAEVSGEAVDYSLYLLIGAGVILVIAIIVVLALSSRKKSATSQAGAALPNQSLETTEMRNV